jgi:hypothetical protein
MLVVALGPMRAVVYNRLSSLFYISQDFSLNDRLGFYRDTGILMLQSPLGAGLGGTGVATKLSSDSGHLSKNAIVDSGVLDLFSSLGWLGGIPFLVGVTILVRSSLNGRRHIHDEFSIVLRIVPVALLSTSFLVNPLVGITGLLFWSAVGLGLSGLQVIPEVSADSA